MCWWPQRNGIRVAAQPHGSRGSSMPASAPPPNVELVIEAVGAAAAAGRDVANSADAAALLGLVRTMESAPR